MMRGWERVSWVTGILNVVICTSDISYCDLRFRSLLEESPGVRDAFHARFPSQRPCVDVVTGACDVPFVVRLLCRLTAGYEAAARLKKCFPCLLATSH